MTQAKTGMVHEAVAEMILNSANPSRQISTIIKGLEEIKKTKEIKLSILMMQEN
jgi:hypothetical protein